MKGMQHIAGSPSTRSEHFACSELRTKGHLCQKPSQESTTLVANRGGGATCAVNSGGNGENAPGWGGEGGPSRATRG